MTAVLTMGLLFSGLFFSIPMFVVMIGTSFLVFWLTSNIPLSILPQRIFAGLESFPLLAIPFFILAANIMGKGGLSDRLISFIQLLAGHLPGGMGITVVMTCVMFGSITGSSASTIVAVGGILYPALIQAGYSQQFSLGVVTSSALIGMIIPPSNAMIVYGSVANVSIGALFMSGIGAGLVFAFVYSAYCVIWAIYNKVPRRKRATWREAGTSARNVMWGLGMPLIILGGIYGGVFTATEAAAVSVIYSAFVCVVIYRELTVPQLWDVCMDSALASARILIMVGAASCFSWLLTVTGVTAAFVQPISSLKESPNELLFAVNVLTLVGGMFVDVFSNLLILVPILLGTVLSAGIGGVHLGIIMSVNADIGNITPPFGLNLFVSSATFDKSYTTVVKACAPWIVLSLICLAIITYFPAVSLWLPQQLYPGIR
ncbi:MAG: C4-dicarboxylate transporter, DctM subunit [Alphaproteobacteria bacterium]|nr:C4-dicarboxylate transporter, DctM subunit [Alphaproteobacteria bacterium]